MPHFHVQLLGEFRLIYDDNLVTTVNTPRLQALLGYLLLHRATPQSRRHLAFLFWPDSSEAQARTNLRHQFHLLRQALPALDDFLLTDGQIIQWRNELPLQLDVAEFERATDAEATLPTLQVAVDRYGGDLLLSCYDDWILPLRERLRQRFLEAVERLISLLEQGRAYDTAIRYAERLRHFDPLYEATYRHLMRLYALLGDQAGVQRVYQTCVTLLQRELAAPPTPATQQLYRQLAGIETPLTQRHNLVAALTPFVGRQADLTKLATLLSDPTCRLLTILGAGGMGKTRIALEAAHGQIGRFLHGVYVVPLAPVTSPAFIVSTIADQIKFTFYGPQEPRIQILNYLREKELLLVLDSIEHLLAGTDLLVDILRHAPAVKLLVTSRERLKIAGEWLYEIQGLPVPSTQQVEQGNEFSAVQLFVQSVQRTQTDFIPNTEDMAAIVHLCQLVEGMPLGIELAASWIRLLSCAEIVQEVTQSLDLLATAAPTGLERHRNMRAVFDHSWHLLTPAEQLVFQRLAVFQGGFRREAAIQVAGASLTLLAALVDKSLVRWNRQGRYEMHELIQQYASEKLAEVPTEQATVQDRQGRYYLEFLRQQEEHLKSSQQQRAIAEIRAEIDNIRFACQRSIRQAWGKELREASQSLWLFYDSQGWYHEAAEIFKQAAISLRSDTLDAVKMQESQKDLHREQNIALGQMLAQQGWFSMRVGLIGDAYGLLQQSLTLLRQFDAQVALADTLQFLGVVNWLLGNYAEAQLLHKEGLSIYQAHKTYQEYKALHGIALCLGSLGLIEQSLGEYAKAQRLMQEGLAIFQMSGNERMTAMALNYLSHVTFILGDYAKAKQWLHESLALSRQIGDRWNISFSLTNLGVMILQSDPTGYEEAIRLHSESLLIAQEMGDRREMATALNHLGHLACILRDYPAAKQYFLTALQSAIDGQIPPSALLTLFGLATVFCYQADTAGVIDLMKERSAELLTLVLHHPATTQETKDKAQSLWNELTTMLTPAQVVAAQERGRARTLEEAATMLLAENR